MLDGIGKRKTLYKTAFMAVRTCNKFKVAFKLP